MYGLVRNILFKFDSEKIHDTSLKLGGIMKLSPLRKAVLSMLQVRSDKLRQNIAGLELSNPVGLAAGFDKPGKAIDMFSSFGFGYLELGTITPKPQDGNPKPRIFRFTEGEALVNRMGFPSEGVAQLLPNLKKTVGRKDLPLIGVNIGKNKSTPLDNAAEDYLAVFELVKTYADYVTINVSSPNTPELRKLQEPARLTQLFSTIAEKNTTKIPVFVKIAPDLTEQELAEILQVIRVNKVSAIIATNTTIDRSCLPAAEGEKGGLSGAPLHEKSLSVVRNLYAELKGEIPIIGVGGIMDGQSAERMIRAGAAAVQVYTGLVYRGPGLVKEINLHLLEVLEREGLSSVSELVGRDA